MLIALLLIPGGILLVVYTDQVVNFTGKINFAEKWFISGGTYTFIKILGLCISITGFMWATGTLQYFLRSVLAPFL